VFKLQSFLLKQQNRIVHYLATVGILTINDVIGESIKQT